MIIELATETGTPFLALLEIGDPCCPIISHSFLLNSNTICWSNPVKIMVIGKYLIVIMTMDWQ